MADKLQRAIRNVENDRDFPFVAQEEITITINKSLLEFLRAITDGDEDEVNRLVAHEATEGIHGLVSAHCTPKWK